jgi:acyl-CoA synthetase (AMP-forming)/AMP-acid ligase II
LVDERDASSPVSLQWDSASRADRIHDWGEFRAQVAGLGHRIAEHPAGPWVLLTENAYAFAVGLLALWHAGRHAISPPNHQPATLRQLEARAVGVISDRPDWLPESAHLHPLAAASGGSSVALAPLRSDAIALELFTSGTTGPEKPVWKRIGDLDLELRVLAGLWDARLGDASILASASHQHLYGLLFGVLWPLAAGRVFYAHRLLHAGELLPRARQEGEFAIVSVPAHLKRLGGHLAMASVRDGCRAVFSSGGPLPAETAHRIARLLGSTPIEVLGSTETGGFAWRTQEPARTESLWTLFPGVGLTRDPETEVARVCSPFASPDEPGNGVATGDRIDLRPDGRFQLKGRADRVVKVGEKRIDLAQMESHLRAHPCVADAALTLIRHETEPRVAAAVVPTERGWDLLRREGRVGLRAELSATLAESWDPVSHPRYWRTVSRLPENAQGKVTAEALRELFRDDENAATFAERPEVLEEVHGGGFLERSCRVPVDLSCFSGHFPGSPMVPAALQLDWVMDLVADLLDAAASVEAIDLARFSAPLRPGDRFSIQVRDASADRVEFRLWNGDREYARGRVRIASRRLVP